VAPSVSGVQRTGPGALEGSLAPRFAYPTKPVGAPTELRREVGLRLLRRVLYWQATLWTVAGAVEIAAPRWFLETVFRQPPYPDVAYVRSMGVMCVTFSLLMVLVAQRIEDVWWWAWAFALTDAALATVCVLNALLGPVDGSATTYWWLLGAGNVAFASGLLVGMARTGQERPFA
jgi:hypothetical protein